MFKNIAISSATILLASVLAASYSYASSSLLNEAVILDVKIRQPVANSGSISWKKHSMTDYAEQYFISKSATRYEITEATTIFGKNGKELTAEQLKLPCKVKMESEKLSNGFINVKTIQVTHYMTSSSSDWFTPNIE